jgi:eukaryotic-like serine/threonine-protein kinase
MRSVMGRKADEAPDQRAQPGSRDDETKSSWDLAEGDEIGPGRTAVRLLGGGARYEAYLAWDDQLLSLVVAKVLRPALVDDEAAQAALAAEARTLRRLRHPVIVRPFDAALHGERPHLVLEYVDGPRLSTLIRTSAIALEQTLSLGLQLSAAAHYMSARGVVHLDVKPQNIIMAGPARLIDLSLARRKDALPSISSPIGTTKYMAPEQCDPARFHDLGSATDVWGIGVTLYWMLAKDSPFPLPGDDDTAPIEERYPQLAHEPAPLPAAVPPELAELILATLSSEATRRPTARELLEALEPMMAALPRPRLGRFRVSRRTSR